MSKIIDALEIALRLSAETDDEFTPHDRSLIESALAEERAVRTCVPIEQLLEEYAGEGCDFSDMDWVRRAAQRYIQTMPDSQVRCLLHVLAAAPPAPAAKPVACEPSAVHSLVAAANAVLAANPHDDTMWSLEAAVQPFNTQKPKECAQGCPKGQVCDYCQIAAPPPVEASQQQDWPECSGDPMSCPENEGYGCCKPNRTDS